MQIIHNNNDSTEDEKEEQYSIKSRDTIRGKTQNQRGIKRF